MRLGSSCPVTAVVSPSCPCPLTPAVSAVSHVSQLIPPSTSPPIPPGLPGLTGMQPGSTLTGHTQAPAAAATQDKGPQ
eukprot:2229107-Amphidinium_carterae.1